MKLSVFEVILMVATSAIVGAFGLHAIKFFREVKKREQAELIREVIREEMKKQQ